VANLWLPVHDIRSETVEFSAEVRVPHKYRLTIEKDFGGDSNFEFA
jgi:hypothetical protein